MSYIVQVEKDLLNTRKPSVAVRYRNKLWPETWVPLHSCYFWGPRTFPGLCPPFPDGGPA